LLCVCCASFAAFLAFARAIAAATAAFLLSATESVCDSSGLTLSACDSSIFGSIDCSDCCASFAAFLALARAIAAATAAFLLSATESVCDSSDLTLSVDFSLILGSFGWSVCSAALAAFLALARAIAAATAAFLSSTGAVVSASSVLVFSPCALAAFLALARAIAATHFVLALLF